MKNMEIIASIPDTHRTVSFFIKLKIDFILLTFPFCFLFRIIRFYDKYIIVQFFLHSRQKRQKNNGFFFLCVIIIKIDEEK